MLTVLEVQSIVAVVEQRAEITPCTGRRARCRQVAGIAQLDFAQAAESVARLPAACSQAADASIGVPEPEDPRARRRVASARKKHFDETAIIGMDRCQQVHPAVHEVVGTVTGERRNRVAGRHDRQAVDQLDFEHGFHHAACACPSCSLPHAVVPFLASRHPLRRFRTSLRRRL